MCISNPLAELSHFTVKQAESKRNIPWLGHRSSVYQNKVRNRLENSQNPLYLLLKSNEAKCSCLCSLNVNLPSCCKQWKVRTGCKSFVCSSSGRTASWLATESQTNEQAGLGFGAWRKRIHYTRVSEIAAQTWAAKSVSRHRWATFESFWACSSLHEPFYASV